MRQELQTGLTCSNTCGRSSRCARNTTSCEPRSEACPNGWDESSSQVPDPWVALAARADLLLVREDIAEPARYYDAHRAIVLRKRLLRADERRFLWRELVHADRRDVACQVSSRVEASVNREAARRALPLVSLEWAARCASDSHDFAELLRLPEPWVQFRPAGLHPAERTVLSLIASQRAVSA